MNWHEFQSHITEIAVDREGKMLTHGAYKGEIRHSSGAVTPEYTAAIHTDIVDIDGNAVLYARGADAYEVIASIMQQRNAHYITKHCPECGSEIRQGNCVCKAPEVV